MSTCRTRGPASLDWSVGSGGAGDDPEVGALTVELCAQGGPEAGAATRGGLDVKFPAEEAGQALDDGIPAPRDGFGGIGVDLMGSPSFLTPVA